MGSRWWAIGFLALVVVVALVRLAWTFGSYPIATTVVIAAIVGLMFASWPAYVRRRDRWISALSARVPGASAVRASAFGLDAASSPDKPIPGMLVILPDALEFWRTWSLWRRDPHLALRLPWSAIADLTLGAPASPIVSARRIVIEREDGKVTRVAILAPGFFAIPIDPVPTLSAVAAFRSGATA